MGIQLNNNDFTIVFNGLIPIYKNKEDENLVSARKLWLFLEISKQFTDWIKYQIESLGLIKNIDYTTISQNCENGGKRNEYILTLATAEHIAMASRTEQGKNIRKYFINARDQLKELIKTPKLEVKELLKLAYTELEKKDIVIKQKDQEVKEKEAFIEDNIDTSRTYSLKTVAIILNNNFEINRRGSSTQKWTKTLLGKNMLSDFLKETKILDYEDTWSTIRDKEIKQRVLVPTHDYKKYFVIRPKSGKDKDTGEYSAWQTIPDVNYDGLRYLYKLLKSDKFKTFCHKRYQYQEIDIKYNEKLVIDESIEGQQEE